MLGPLAVWIALFVFVYLGMQRSRKTQTEAQAMAETPQLCRACGSVVEPQRISKLNGCFLVVLLLCFIIPGILYWVWAGTQRVKVCPRCGVADNFLPVDSPEARRLAAQDSVTPSPVKRDETQCPWCAETILAAAKVCKHCGRNVQSDVP